MRRDGIMVAKCTVERLMRAMGLTGVRRGKKTITTISNPKAPCPLDKVNREFRVSRPNALWVVDFTYVHTWAGFAPADCRVEGQHVSHCGLRSGCPGAGDPCPQAWLR
jgi:transposase InsO family protein